MATIRKGRGSRKRARARRVRIGAPDARLTPAAGVEAVRELDAVLGIGRELDSAIGPVKVRDRGLSGGQLLISMASCQLAGGDHLVSLDRRRADVAGQQLEPVPTPPSTTAAGIARRFGAEEFAGIETGIAAIHAKVVPMLGRVRSSALLRSVTIDGDTTDVEVYGRSKERARHAYTGALTLRPHLAVWAETGVPVAAELTGGTDDARSSCVDLLDRALAGLPPGVGQVATRWDAGYFAADLATACLARDVRFAIGAKRSQPLFRAAAAVPEHAWGPVHGMDGDTHVAVVDYRPRSWPAQARCLARRTRIPVGKIPTARARKRRTIPTDQLTLALDRRCEYVYAYSFILTDLPVDTPEQVAGVEWWYRHRTDIEAVIRDAKHGAALRHLPSADHGVNTVWMWSALLAVAISAWIQELTGIDRGNGRGRVTLARLRRELITVPARLTHRGGTTWLRLPPGPHILSTVLPRLQQLPRSG